MAYTHITKEQRFKIQSWLEINMSQKDISEHLGKDESSLSREISRNTNSLGKYTAGLADKASCKRRMNGKKKSRKLIKDKKLRRAVLQSLKRNQSPEQIGGRRKRLHKDYVVHETVYSYMYDYQPEWKIYLRQKKGKYRRRHGTTARENRREQAKKRRIDERPAVIDARTEIGHFEGDTVKGKDNSGSIGTHVERVTGYSLGHLMHKVTAKVMSEQTVKQFKKIPKEKKSKQKENRSTHLYTATLFFPNPQILKPMLRDNLRIQHIPRIHNQSPRHHCFQF